MLTAEFRLEDRSGVGKLYSGGLSDGGGESLAVLDKATGESLADVVVATPDDVARAVSIATEAQRAWAQTYAVEQRAVFIRPRSCSTSTMPRSPTGSCARRAVCDRRPSSSSR
jgi:hypothetical protein